VASLATDVATLAASDVTAVASEVATLSAPEAMEVATETMSERTWADASGAARPARRRMEEGRMVEGGGYRGEVGDVSLVDERCRKESWRG
jgi:hypothetical protein